MNKELKDEIVPHNCGDCTHFNFDWNRYWCGISQNTSTFKENYIQPIPSTKTVMDIRKICPYYKRGYSHNHEW